MENKVIAKEYVEKNYIARERILDKVLDVEFTLQQHNVDWDDSIECEYEGLIEEYWERRILRKLLEDK